MRIPEMAGYATKKLGLKGRIIAVDSETTGLFPWAIRNVELNFGTERQPDIERRDVHPAKAFAWSFCDLDGNTAYIRHKVNPLNREIIYENNSDCRLIKDFWADDSIVKVGHNIAFDVLMSLKMMIKRIYRNLLHRDGEKQRPIVGHSAIIS